LHINKLLLIQKIYQVVFLSPPPSLYFFRKIREELGFAFSFIKNKLRADSKFCPKPNGKHHFWLFAH